MADLRVTCISKIPPGDRYEHITHLGGYGWKWGRTKVIYAIETHKDTFYVIDRGNGKRSEVGVMTPRYIGAPFLGTRADGDWNDNLLALPQCP